MNSTSVSNTGTVRKFKIGDVVVHHKYYFGKWLITRVSSSYSCIQDGEEGSISLDDESKWMLCEESVVDRILTKYSAL